MKPTVKRVFALLLMGLLLFPHLARALDMPFKQLAPGVYVFIGETGLRTYENEGMNANAGFIVTRAGVVVVDSGPSYQVAQTIHAAIRKVTRQPVKYVINTGGQDHRWLGNGYFKAQGAEIIASAAAVDDMNARGAMQLEGLKGELKEKLAGTEVVLPTKTFEKEMTLKLGGRDSRILHFQPAHTPGDSIVWLPGEGVVFAGDIVFVDRLLGVLPFSSARGWLASFEDMAKLKPRLIVPGHGDVCDLAKARRETADYLDLLISHMKNAVDNMVDLQVAIDGLDQSKWAYLANYELLKGGNANRVYLEMESR
jgi:glyoxylase-like metal-dependent hydrolase (beta-lactamase superfamily II)